MSTLHGIEINVGDKVWDLYYGWSDVVALYDREKYKIMTNNDTYTTDGKCNTESKWPTLFWNEFKIPKEAFIKPLPKIEVDTKVIVWRNGDPMTERRYFSHFDDEGRINCFNYGSTSWTNNDNETSPWDYWRLFKENIDD
jgi:hypothetical protein